jgi:hypothetical protein
MTTTHAPKPTFALLDTAALNVDTESLAAQVNPLVAKAKALAITNQAQDEAAQHDLLTLKTVEKFVQTVFKGPKATLDKAHADMCAQEKTWLDPIKEAARITFEKHTTYETAERAAAEAERKRLEEIAQREEEEKREQDALRAEAAGDDAGAVEILDRPVDRPIVHVQAAVTKVRGVGAPKSTWSAEVFDFKALVKHIAKNCDKDPGLLAYLEAASTALNGLARAQQSALSLPGVRAVERKSPNIRTA